MHSTPKEESWSKYLRLRRLELPGDENPPSQQGQQKLSWTRGERRDGEVQSMKCDIWESPCILRTTGGEDTRSNMQSIVRTNLKGYRVTGRGSSPTSGVGYFSSGPQSTSQTADPSTRDLAFPHHWHFCPCLVTHAVFKYPQKTQQAVLCLGTSHVPTPGWGLSTVVWVWAKL